MSHEPQLVTANCQESGGIPAREDGSGREVGLESNSADATASTTLTPSAHTTNLATRQFSACLNCGTSLHGPFCHQCAQRARTEPLNWRWLGHELAYGLFSLDRGIVFSIKELFTRPGHAVRDYLEGKRKRYFPPITLVALISLASTLVMAILPVDYTRLVVPDAAHTDAAMAQWMEWYIDHQGLFYLVFTPFMALSTWLVMRKYGHGFIEHVVINTFIAGQIAVMSLMTWPLALIENQLTSMVATLFMAILMCWTFVQLYSAKAAWRVLLRTIFAFIAAIAIPMMFAVIIGLVVELG